MQVHCSSWMGLAILAAAGCSMPPSQAEDAQADAVAPVAQALDHGALVQIEDGVVQGALRDGSRVFIGIPYAAPPVGELRWRPPAPVKPWDGALDATGPGRSCINLLDAAPTPDTSGAPGALGLPVASEDCLQLNVFAPEHPHGEKVPVMVWLHGGGNATGSANDQLAPGVANYDGGRLRKAAPREVVIVSLNYRLGPLGFLAHPALSDESSKHVSGNYGLLDQQAALRWVQKNIAAFGGDPENVTLFGESAGSFDTCYQAVLTGSDGLFHRMIMESGSCTLKVSTLAEGESEGAAFAQRLGCDGSDDSVLECLRAKSADVLQLRDLPAYPGSPFFTNPDPTHVAQWGELNPGLFVVVDGVHLKEQPIAAFAAGRYAHVPTIIGTNAREGAEWFVDGDGLFDNQAQFRAAIKASFKESAQLLEKQYDADRYPSVNEAALDLITDFFFNCPAWQLARRMSRESDVYVYNWTRGVHTPDSEKYGAAHSVELVWVWDIWSATLGVRKSEAPLVAQTAAYWTALAESGDPNREGSPSWPKYSDCEDRELDINLVPHVEAGRRDARCAVWAKAFAAGWGDDWAEPSQR